MNGVSVTQNHAYHNYVFNKYLSKVKFLFITFLGLLCDIRRMTNLDSLLKSRNITLLTKVCTVKAVVFPVIIYSCESQTIKKAEHQIIDAFELYC